MKQSGMLGMSSHDSESIRGAVVVALRALADSLERLPAGDVSAFLDGELEPRLMLVAKTKGRRKGQQKTREDVEHWAQIRSRLQSLGDRAAGADLLREVVPSRFELELFARYLDVPVRREDRLDDVLNRIIEATIGFRLASAAVQGRTGVRKPKSKGSAGVAAGGRG